MGLVVLLSEKNDRPEMRGIKTVRRIEWAEVIAVGPGIGVTEMKESSLRNKVAEIQMKFWNKEEWRR